eukprot:CAMPEP_0181244422 /NCGR_PEP_ID=MMETSP1096-20121128/42853_1 /TAXON_ID=156174 ORGANISM="Chrysochromulina ericina, Strain CCMP281" /NCGR_SAMPLE_ID=MMETSP1096 /ASSEMBLY_ACC=CAM_ASM_000453 /LENGTH=138 /DNA_ID=CAMNT_0023340973 /DNA_START=1062 /DNA_END=1479 /DNA_ORIENTATION=-
MALRLVPASERFSTKVVNGLVEPQQGRCCWRRKGWFMTCSAKFPHIALEPIRVAMLRLDTSLKNVSAGCALRAPSTSRLIAQHAGTRVSCFPQASAAHILRNKWVLSRIIAEHLALVSPLAVSDDDTGASATGFATCW